MHLAILPGENNSKTLQCFVSGDEADRGVHKKTTEMKPTAQFYL